MSNNSDSDLEEQHIFKLAKIIRDKAFGIASSHDPICSDKERLEIALTLINAVDDLYMGDTLKQRKLFEEAEKVGVHILRPNYYSPLPIIGKLKDEIWEKLEESGINWNEEFGVSLINKLSLYSGEFRELVQSNQFDLHNDAFGFHDAVAYYSMIRNFRPKTIIEVGGGHSTKLAALACMKNNFSNLTCIEPYPRDFLKHGFVGLTNLIEKPVQEVPLSMFQQLEENDILFIDSTHISKIDSDVNYLILEILPQIKKGVIIHLHDIFLPLQFPKYWIKDLQLFWNEQYLLHAFLIGNSDFEVLFGNQYMAYRHPQVLKNFYDIEPVGGGSFWMRKVR